MTVVLYKSKNNFEEISAVAKQVAAVFKHKEEIFKHFESKLDKAEVISIFKEFILHNDNFSDEEIDKVVKNINSKNFYNQAIESVIDPDSELDPCRWVYIDFKKDPKYVENLISKIKTMKNATNIDYAISTLCVVINSTKLLQGKVKMLKQINYRFDAFLLALLLISWIKSSFTEEQKKKGFVYYCVSSYDEEVKDELEEIDF